MTATTLFFPKIRSMSQLLPRVLQELGVTMINDPSQSYEFAVKWDYANESDPLDLYKPTINNRCVNVRKDYVDHVHNEVFGYRTIIDPMYYCGNIVMKSTQNAVHNGTIIQGPLPEIEHPGYYNKNEFHKVIYQRLINNQVSFEEVNNIPDHPFTKDDIILREYRVTICGRRIAAIIERLKTDENRFHPYKPNKILNRWMEVRPNDIFGRDMEKILEFAQIFPVDFADFDILFNRDEPSQPLYIVDVNNIASATMAWSLPNRKEFIANLAELFKKEFLENEDFWNRTA